MTTPIHVTPPSKLEIPNFREIWDYKDLMFYLVKRDLKVRFQQTFIGVLWLVLQPLIQMTIFYIIFGILVKVPTGEVPYSVFYLSGYVIWQLFNQVVSLCAYSLLNNVGIITKIYFPRLILPISATISSIIDFVISFCVLLIFLFFNHYLISWRYVLIPLLVSITLIFSLGVGLLFGALMVIFRDTKNLLGFIMQIWMFVSPIMYPITIAPESSRYLFYLNPLTGIIDAFRWIFLHNYNEPNLAYLAVSAIVGLVLLCFGLIFFKSMENRIADVM